MFIVILHILVVERGNFIASIICRLFQTAHSPNVSHLRVPCSHYGASYSWPSLQTLDGSIKYFSQEYRQAGLGSNTYLYLNQHFMYLYLN